MCHAQGDNLASGLGTAIALRCSQLKPFIGFDSGFESGLRRFCQAETVSPHPEHVLSARIAELRRLADPHYGLNRVARDALAAVIDDPEIELGQSVALVGCFLVPLSGLQIIGRASLARKTEPTDLSKTSVLI